MALAHSPKIVSDDLIFLLDAANKKSYDQTGSGGSTWTDLSGNGNNGTLTNTGAIFHEIGSHFKINELLTAGTGYVEMGNVLGTSYTKNIWFRTNAANNNNLMSGSGSAGTTVFWCASGERYIAAGHSSNYNPGSNAIVDYDSGSTTGLRTWHNACVTYSSTGTTMKLYVNGILVDTGTETAHTDFSLHIGAYINQYELSGDVAYASLYNRALTAEEVLQNYNAIKNRSAFTSNAANTAPSYSATPASSSVNEGSSLTINVATTNVPTGTTLYFLNSRPADFPSSSDSGSFTINNNAGSFTVTPSADSTTEGTETFTVDIKTGSTSGTTVATTSSITINDTSTKIVCTALNEIYGYGSFRNKLWMRYNDYDKARYPTNSKIVELGYHKVFGKLTEMMPNSPLLTKVLRRVARVRTDRIRREMSGKPLTLESKLHVAIIRPINYTVGWLVHKGILKEYKRKVKS